MALDRDAGEQNMFSTVLFLNFPQLESPDAKVAYLGMSLCDPV